VVGALAVLIAPEASAGLGTIADMAGELGAAEHVLDVSVQ
jgi:hypothetical protein